MNFQENYSLKKHNTFHLDVAAKYFAQVRSEAELLELLHDPICKNSKILILGDGANILFTKDYEGVVLQMKIKGIKLVEEDADSVKIEVGAGENWHELVVYTVERGWGGIENMIYIPGTAGAAVVQNIAAYGQNLYDVFHSLVAVETETGISREFKKSDCEFQYRDSRFKSRERGKYCVIKIRLKLAKNPKINTSYFETGKTTAKNTSLSGELSGIENPTVKDVAGAVMTIRKNKLPDVSEVGTAGSFFKNPVVTWEKYQELRHGDENLQCYPIDGLNYVNMEGLSGDDKVKIPAGRLLDNLGWKGKRIGNVGTHPTQALAVVSYGAEPKEILQFTDMMKQAVFDNYHVLLEPEVLII